MLFPAGDWFRLSQGNDVPSISGDGLELYADFGGQGNNHIWTSTRGATSEPFGNPVQVDDLSDSVRLSPFVSFDGQTLYFSENGDLYWAAKSDSGFDEPQLIAATVNPDGASRPVVSHDERTLYFASARTDGTAQGGSDIWVSSRVSANDEFRLPKAVDELNTNGHERPVWVADDGCEIFIIRSTIDSPSTSHVMVAVRPL